MKAPIPHARCLPRGRLLLVVLCSLVFSAVYILLCCWARLPLCLASCLDHQPSPSSRPTVLGPLHFSGYSSVPDGKVSRPGRGCQGAPTLGAVVSHTSVPLLLRNYSHYFRQARDTLYVVWGQGRHMDRARGGRTYRALLQLSRMYPGLRLYTFTEGMMARCDQIFQDETGRNREESHPSVPYHYFEKGHLDECQMYLAHERAPRSAHRFLTEKAVFSRWAKKRSILFAHPSWRTE
ncbi:alpha-N-acetyl-neuraminyl-2,3-beta-galactosyl-1,3-N-acetyl-galactosaminide alpha-2,6-sialyltransferase [Carlito syrichta]|uniref:Alpha-N-acetyl-neuraminyl-2,3-beta-galactosyl-1, 3-N-acetyl-galactosaminide alpha-2,6-sialyltransferase n=1 Tax=Carlito syrichta TaxID=1868482 RepID=A0A3Q0DK42_CARSF|nr:alpha-N-acetyl-neuraminyl-2,3-beta-galactosyl-1,3-N-acetyl-galactosaminide alpha-2,6-sialyltransferase [Carlito syrichta]